MAKLAVFDFDSTLVAMEGIDELAKLKLGDEGFRRVVEATQLAMAGDIDMGSSLVMRLELVRPSVHDCQQLAAIYTAAVVPGAVDAVAALARSGWEIAVVSGGFDQAIRPVLAAHFSSVSMLRAAVLRFTPQGEYAGLDGDASPTALAHGKLRVVQALRSRYDTIVMIGDGATDAEAAPAVDAFIACTAVVRRPAVVTVAAAVLENYEQLTEAFLLKACNRHAAK